MRIGLCVLVLAACGEVKNDPVDAQPSSDTPTPIDAPSIDADLRPRFVFVTSSTHNGNVGGLLGADAICNQRAMGAALAGTFMAWLANATDSPATRMTRGIGPYRLTTGIAIAQNWDDLTDGVLAARVDRDEARMLSQGTFICRGGEVWSNVDAMGNRRAGVTDCGGWLSNTATGTAGNVTDVNAEWTASTCTSIGCNSTLPIYCVEQ